MANDNKSRLKVNWVKGVEMENIEDKSIIKSIVFAIYCGGIFALCAGASLVLHQILK
jgi:hypothetical protein